MDADHTWIPHRKTKEEERDGGQREVRSSPGTEGERRHREVRSSPEIGQEVSRRRARGEELALRER